MGKNMSESLEKINELMKKGVDIKIPESVFISSDIDTKRIFKGATIFPGARIYGKRTLILKGASIGTEGPVTIKDCFIGENVEIKSGYIEGSVFLDKANIGAGAHVRKGSILEEGASCAHTVGLKQTILFPYVTLGSLINFCDCFMSGGTSRKDHSEVGSSYIHFNYTPNQDKATASLIGDVPKGVMLNNSPIFLGGQGGLVGPCRLTYGDIIAAGTVQRKDELREDRLMFGGLQKSGNIPFKKGFTGVPRIVINNITYIANLIALNEWYHHVRVLFISESFPEELLDGLKETLEIALNERVKRLKDFFHKVCDSQYKEDTKGLVPEIYENGETLCDWLQEARIKSDLFEGFKQILVQNKGSNYIDTIKSLPEDCSVKGTLWLNDIVQKVKLKTDTLLPTLKIIK